MAEAPGPLRATASVVANRNDGGANYRLELEVLGWPGSDPGQFAMLSPGAVGGVFRSDPLLPRPMAIYRETGPDRFEILYKVIGRGTRLLSEAAAGASVFVVGPLGRGFVDPEADERPVLVGGGTGIASLYALASGLAGRFPVTVLFGAAAAVDLMGVDDFDALDVDFRIATEDGSRGRRGRVTDLLEVTLDEPGPSRVYTCGPTPMMRRVAEIAESRGVPTYVSLENHMACGFGVCLGCAAPRSGGGFSLVCRDGPVFDASALAWDGLP